MPTPPPRWFFPWVGHLPCHTDHLHIKNPVFHLALVVGKDPRPTCVTNMPMLRTRKTFKKFDQYFIVKTYKSKINEYEYEF